MLGRWAICPFCGGEIDWREREQPNDEMHPLYPLSNDTQENER
jgi:hypothetical protein